MKALKNKSATGPMAPVFPPVAHKVREKAAGYFLISKPNKQKKMFSKSRDLSEVRGERQMKSSHSVQSFAHGR